MHAFSFAGRTLHALPERALWWPDRRAILVADMHLEKASWFAATSGQMLPPFDSDDTLMRLTRLVEHYRPAEIWALGDSFHDSAGPTRLSDDIRGQLARLATGRRFVWITGNHDEAAAMPGERLSEAEIDGVVLRHETQPGDPRPEISGHFHPKLRLHAATRGVSRPCFAGSPNRLILPAFGAFTGGLDVTDPALAAPLGPEAFALVPTRSKLLLFPLADTGRRHRA